MAGPKRESALTKEEKKIVGVLLADGLRNQDVTAPVNIVRGAIS